MSDVVFKSALELGRMLKKKKLSSVELLGECLTQYARHNERINAVILTDLSRAELRMDAFFKVDYSVTEEIPAGFQHIAAV